MNKKVILGVSLALFGIILIVVLALKVLIVFRMNQYISGEIGVVFSTP